ncbi:DevR family CRISPR-associated autoregulator [Clostridium cellulovorans]|uniref:CRISPR-associated autoregulator DevR family n=1 Tax=Clostridium cellulovorans (strain ATCC 35296 / DSM 3052 / OCM 3 / 743B) TaxID=573061 RepID=D9SP81_CLOC7|nr:DevR family CRISPR-associated autoregulator [Clostridium cellulovorans]ADL52046.1 CRISPR-associated autoregulator DevR family [Clostridium cellulovorans 743B]
MNKLAIMMLLIVEGEALNNEGNIGNTMQPRQIELSDGSIRNAIAGEMLKHFHTKNVRLLADEDELCDTCKIFSPMKNGTVKEKDKNLSDSGNRVKQCIVDDIEGFMNAGKGNNEKRVSCIKFSWAISTDDNDYQSVLHNRVDPINNKGKNEKNLNEQGKPDTTSEANTNKDQNTQMLFYRPIRSNEYALTIQIDLDRIGLDDEKLIDAVDNNTKIMRQRKCLKAVKNMFLDLEGALCSTRLPHLTDIQGIIVQKKNKDEVLSKYSALKEDFIQVNKRLSNNSFEFNNIEEFAAVIDDIGVKLEENL